jgi:ABC-type nitrate/sulfonate/bicarbonate transport system ATPase subunit
MLVVAAAGNGKTTALRVLARVWTDDGGHVVGPFWFHRRRPPLGFAATP